MDDKRTKQVLTLPDLPTAIKGDGRYFLSLMRKYLASVNTQVNIANGYTADDEKAEITGDFPAPKNFTLTFDRLGGVLNWDSITDVNLAYYEVRTNANVGSQAGLLERTTNTSSTALPVYASGKVYLFAVSKANKHSNGVSITYGKRRPEAPQDISLTRNNEGTLVTFLDIPSDCMGAYVYIDGVRYITIDNVYLYPGFYIKKLAVSYFDQFGEGAQANINCFVPDVTGFWVEKNGANLDFYWDAVAVYNARYIVKVGRTQDWEQGVELFTAKATKHRYVRPNSGDYYFMIKAVDDHNNFSEKATWYRLISSPEINKNIIMEFNQEQVGYNGTKLNMYLDSSAGGLRLEDTAFNGEYILKMQLPQVIKARNWVDVKINAVTSQNLRICDATFPLDSYESQHVLVSGIIGDLDGVQLQKQIARHKEDKDIIFSAITDGTIATSGGTIDQSHKVEMIPARWTNGAFISDVTNLSYTCDIPEEFSISFWIKAETLYDCIIMELYGDNKSLYIGYDKRLHSFYVYSDSNDILLASVSLLERDWVFIGVSQDANVRTLYVFGYSYDSKKIVKGKIAPCGPFTKIFCYPRKENNK